MTVAELAENNTLLINQSRAMQQARELRPWAKAAVAVIIFCALGFPGAYTKVFGDYIGVLFDYGIFLLQIFLMIIYSGNAIGEIRIINIKVKYAPVYLFLIAIFVVSMLATPDKGKEVISCVRFSTTALFALWICDHMSVEEFLEAVYHAMIMYVFSSVIFAVLFSGYYDRSDDQMHAFLGINNSKNSTAGALCLGIIMQLLLWKLRTSGYKNVSSFFVGFFAAQIFLMVLADSKGVMLYCIAVVFLILFFGDRVRVNVGLVSVIASILFLVFAMTLLPLMEPALEAIGKDATLTGRLPLWNQLLDIVRENHTLIGFGYGHFWLDKEALDLLHVGFNKDSFMNQMNTGAHNNLIEMWINTGLIGLLSCFAMLIAAFSRAGQMSSEKYLFCMAYMAYYTLIGFTERSWVTFGYRDMFLFIAVGYACSKADETQ